MPGYSTGHHHENNNENRNNNMSAPQGLFASAGVGGSAKLEELEDKLVLLKPVDVQMVPKPERFGAAPGEMQERATAKVVVLNDDGTWDDQGSKWFFQVGIVPSLKAALQPGSMPYVLGRVAKVPSKIGKEQGLDSTEKINKALEEWLKKGAKGVKPNFAWGMTDFTPEDVALATKYVESLSPMFASPASE